MGVFVTKVKPKTSVEVVLEKYTHNVSTYRQVRNLLDHEMDKGLSKAFNKKATLKMLITYVRNLPSRSEKGNFLALDLGGTNFRVLLITLDGGKANIVSKIYTISTELMTGHGNKLFDYIADCIGNFQKEHNLDNQKLALGFTFSFPCLQQGLASGKLVRWTKGFSCSGVVGKDVVQLLSDSLKRRNNEGVHCVALINDTVGCLVSCALTHSDTYVGVIIGTGTNACYVENLSKVELWNGDDLNPKQVIINTEWGAFGDNGCLDFIRSSIDRDIDKMSVNPGRQIFEKMISGMYLGEIVRRIIVECVRKGLLFNGKLSRELLSPHRFFTKYLSEIEQDDVSLEKFQCTRQVLDELGVVNCTVEDCRGVHKVSSAIVMRAACLVAAATAVLVDRVNRPTVTVGFDGSLYRFHPHFHNLIVSMLQQLTLTKTTATLRLSEDGSGKGAALVAAAAVIP